MSLRHKIAETGAYLKGRSIPFWIRLIVFTTLGVAIGYALEEQEVTQSLRFYSYRLLQKIIPRERRPNYTAVVLIGDDEYWKDPQLAHRAPINRSYLAKLLRALNEADPAVIGLDFDLRSPLPDENRSDDPEYECEIKDLAAALGDIIEDRPIVLARAIGTDSKGNYTIEPNIYDNVNLKRGRCSQDEDCFGYIALPFDPRVLPQRISVGDGHTVKSFAEALAQGVDSTRVPEHAEGSRDLYAGYVDRDGFNGVTLSATEVLKDPRQYKALLHPKAVLVGASWHTRAYDRGSLVDMHLTPVGWMPGVFVHANYVEALLDLRTFPGLSVWMRLPFEWFLTFFVALFMQLPGARRWDLLPLIFGSLVLFVLSSAVFYVFGVLFEFMVPALAILGHYMFEKVLHWRTVALQSEKQ